MKFIITVDTEADNQWKKVGDVSLKNIKYLPRFQSLCEKYNFTPTYLVAYEIANNSNAVEMLSRWQKENRAEIGAHLHPWTNPPFINEEKERRVNTYPCELSDKMLWQKLKSLTEIIKNRFGKSPVSFRAGRWGFDGRIANYLLKLGYKVDCSITPKTTWQKVKGEKNGGPDFRVAAVYPYYLSNKNIFKTAKQGLLEVPMTILYTGILNKEYSRITKWFSRLPNSLLKRGLNKLFFRRQWCRIKSSTKVEDLYKLYQSAKLNQLPAIEFMVHSSELMPGGSPSYKTKDDIEKLYQKLNLFFRYLQENNVLGCSLSVFRTNFEDPKYEGE